MRVAKSFAFVSPLSSNDRPAGLTSKSRLPSSDWNIPLLIPIWFHVCLEKHYLKGKRVPIGVAGRSPSGSWITRSKMWRTWSLCEMKCKLDSNVSDDALGMTTSCNNGRLTLKPR
jgi:hypothetical protein